ncbi:MAG TPA: cupin domain-containing protein [Solirubrobacteraceae bacterium]|nr:cupin domain-containing protein [Solirubrobacteraceae bacterium]
MARVVLRSEETAGAVSIIELSSNAGWPGPPLHRHDFDEAFYVTEGELTFQLGEEVFTRGPGGLAFAPRNVAHTYANHSDAPARALLVCTPAGFERYFARMAAEAAGVEPPEWALQPTPPVEHLGPQIARRA